MTFVMFGCNRCGWHGGSLAELLSHKCDKPPAAAAPRVIITEPVATPQIHAPAPAPVLAKPAPVKEPPATRTFNCPRCGKEVTTTDRRKKFCTHTCAVLASQAAKRAQSRVAKAAQADQLAQVVKVVKAARPPRVYPKKPLWATGNEPPAEIQARLLGVSVKMLPPPAEPQPRISTAAKVSPARRSRLKSMFGQPRSQPARPTTPAAGPEDESVDVSLEPDKLARSGSTPVGPDLTPNPSHPVRSSIKAASWRQLGPERAELTRYCTCGMQIPLKPPERCENCGRRLAANP